MDKDILEIINRHLGDCDISISQIPKIQALVKDLSNYSSKERREAYKDRERLAVLEKLLGLLGWEVEYFEQYCENLGYGDYVEYPSRVLIKSGNREFIIEDFDATDRIELRGLL